MTKNTMANKLPRKLIQKNGNRWRANQARQITPQPKHGTSRRKSNLLRRQSKHTTVPHVIYIHHKQFVPCLVLAIDISFLLPRMAVEIITRTNLFYSICSVAITEILGY